MTVPHIKETAKRQLLWQLRLKKASFFFLSARDAKLYCICFAFQFTLSLDYPPLISCFFRQFHCFSINCFVLFGLFLNYLMWFNFSVFIFSFNWFLFLPSLFFMVATYFSYFMVSAGTLLNSTKCFDYLKSKATLSLRWETFTFSTLWQIRLRATNITYNKRGKGRSDALFFHIKYKCVSANLALLTLAVSSYLPQICTSLLSLFLSNFQS